MVRAEGLEPPQAIAHQDLNLARLPFPPRPRVLPVSSLCHVSEPRHRKVYFRHSVKRAGTGLVGASCGLQYLFPSSRSRGWDSRRRS